MPRRANGLNRDPKSARVRHRAPVPRAIAIRPTQVACLGADKNASVKTAVVLINPAARTVVDRTAPRCWPARRISAAETTPVNARSLPTFVSVSIRDDQCDAQSRRQRESGQKPRHCLMAACCSKGTNSGGDALLVRQLRQLQMVSAATNPPRESTAWPRYSSSPGMWRPEQRQPSLSAPAKAPQPPQQSPPSLRTP